MKALGVDFLTRTVANVVKIFVELKKHGDKYTLSTKSTFKNNAITFELGKEFADETLDGRKVKSVMTFDGNTLVHKQGGTPANTITREFKENELIVTLKVKDVVAVHKYVVEN